MKDVLVFQLARFGDIIQTKRLMLSLKAEENVRVHLCVDECLAGIATLLYPFAIIHALPASNITLGNNALKDTSSNSNSLFLHIFSLCKKTLSELKNINFSKVYILNATALSYALARMFPPEIIRGFSSPLGQPTRSLWTQIISRLMVHRNNCPINLVDYWGFFHPNPIAPSLVNPQAKSFGSERIGVALSGRNSRRSLPPEVLSHCLKSLFATYDRPKVVLLGESSEQPLAKELLRALPSSIVSNIENLLGKTKITDLPEVVSELDCLLSPDTGLMHLASHLGVPTHAFFLSSAWVFETGPYGMGHTVWQSVVECSPCLESAPCYRKVLCLQPFSHGGFLKYLASGSTNDWPETLVCYKGKFDNLGITYESTQGVDRTSKVRDSLRFDVATWLYSQGVLTHIDNAPANYQFSTNIYDDKDGVLPLRAF